MVLHELQEVLVSTAYTAFFVHLEPVLCLSASAHAYYSRHVDIPCCEDTLVHVIVECSFIEHDLISMVDAYMVKRLAFHEKRADNGIQSDRFFFSDLQSLAALRAQCLVFFLCVCRRVYPFFQRTGPFGFAAIANIWRFRKPGANLALIFTAQ